MQQVRAASTSKRLAIFAAIAAGACWGASFIAPRALAETAAITISFFRFFFFGATSAIALTVRRRYLPPISLRALSSAVGLSWAGYSLYYSLLAFGVKSAGVTFATAIIGLLPLTIMLISTPFRQWGALGIPITLITLGGVLIPIELFGDAYTTLLKKSTTERAYGLVATLGSLSLWTAFAVLNARFLRRHPEWSPLDWASLLGVSSAATATALFFILSQGRAIGYFLQAAGDPRVLLWTGFIGIAGAWIASGLWNFASRVLPPAGLGMLLVFESVFGLMFGFLYDHRLPTFREGLAAISLVTGAALGIRALNRLKTSDKSSSVGSESVE